MAHPVQELLCRVPPVCFGCILVCIIIQVIVFLMDVELIDFAIIPRSVIYMQEYYRLVSSAFFHSGLMHIGMNMLSAATFGFMLEKSIGSLALMFLILWSVVLSGFIYCFFAWVAFELTWDMEWLMKAAVGFSGVLFTLAVVESYTATAPTRSFFGVVNVPTRVYPWVLLIILQIMIPQISFLGHLSGLLVGVLYCYGCLGIFMPSTAFLSEMEKWRPFSALAAHPAFTPAPREILIESPSAMWAHAKQGLSWMLVMVRNILATLWHAVLGGGGEPGSHNQRPSPMTAAEAARQHWATGDVEDQQSLLRGHRSY